MTSPIPDEPRRMSTAEWADAINRTGLRAHTAIGYRRVGSGWDFAVHLAMSPSLTEDAQRRLAADIQAAVDAVVSRVLQARIIVEEQDR